MKKSFLKISLILGLSTAVVTTYESVYPKNSEARSLLSLLSPKKLLPGIGWLFTLKDINDYINEKSPQTKNWYLKEGPSCPYTGSYQSLTHNGYRYYNVNEILKLIQKGILKPSDTVRCECGCNNRYLLIYQIAVYR